MAEPNGLLGEIVARKRTDVAARFGDRALADMLAGARATGRSLKAALVQPSIRFVMEVKRSSPSEGLLRSAADPAAIARGYAGAADAISVLVDAPYFGGSYADLAAVRAVYDGPILAKDFVVDPRQVVEARLHGADAVLAMLSILDDAGARAVIVAAERLGMDVLVEVHDEAEMSRAIGLGASIIGINNRDLRTLAIDLGVTERLAALAPAECILVSESGIRRRGDVARLACRVDAFLVGSSLMKAARPDVAARALAYGRVKVCGLTSPMDAAAAQAAGATFGGLIFVPGTPRAVTQAGARAIRDCVPDLAITGVFRDARLMDVANAAVTLGLAAVQLHGHEDTAYINGLRNVLPAEVEIWAASHVGASVPERPAADRLLFDTAVAGRSGGTGRSFDWEQVGGRADLDRSLLAGGLTPDNVQRAASLGAYALDVGSGVEAAPGRKDPARLSAFFAALRPADRRDAACA